LAELDFFNPGERYATVPALSVPPIHFTVTAEGYRSVATQWVGDEPVEWVEFDIILVPD